MDEPEERGITVSFVHCGSYRVSCPDPILPVELNDTPLVRRREATAKPRFVMHGTGVTAARQSAVLKPALDRGSPCGTVRSTLLWNESSVSELDGRATRRDQGSRPTCRRGRGRWGTRRPLRRPPTHSKAGARVAARPSASRASSASGPRPEPSVIATAKRVPERSLIRTRTCSRCALSRGSSGCRGE